jgi:hypothetical protein
MDKHPPCCPGGRITNACAAAEYSRRVTESYPLGGHWRGWRIQGRHLIGPAGVRFTPETAHRAHVEYTQKAVLRGEDEGRGHHNPAQLQLWRSSAHALRQPKQPSHRCGLFPIAAG